MKTALKLIALGGALVLVQVFLRSSLPSALRPDLVLIFAAAMGLRTTGTLGGTWRSRSSRRASARTSRSSAPPGFRATPTTRAGRSNDAICSYVARTSV